MEQLSKTKVGAIVAGNYRTAKVLTDFGIDFCCRGGITLEEACKNENVSLETLMPALEEAYQRPDEENFREMSPTALADHIEKVHHTYVDETAPILLGYLRKVERVHGERHPELSAIRSEFEEAANHLSAHMEKEEMILFPFIRDLDRAEREGVEVEQGMRDIHAPIQMMEHEHDVEGQRMKRISELTNGYQPPRDACQTYRVSFQLLEEFENDLHRHIHLENNVLFPAARERFDQLKRSQN